MSEKIGEAFVEVTAKLDKLHAQLESVQAEVKKSSQKMENTFANTKPRFDTSMLMKGFGMLTSAMGAALAAKKMLADWGAQERATSRLAQALKNAGLAGKMLDESLTSMEAFSSAVQKITTYGDEAVTEVQAMLVAMTGLTGMAVRPLTMATLDLASGLKMDAESAATLIAKTIEGQDALSRYGISVKGAKNDSEKMAMVIDKIAEKFGGFAENELNTVDGKMKNLQNRIGDVNEAFGKMIASGIGPIAPALVGMFEFVGKSIQSIILRMLEQFTLLASHAITILLQVNDLAKNFTKALGPFMPKVGIFSDKFENTLRSKLKNLVLANANAKKELDALWSNQLGPLYTTTHHANQGTRAARPKGDDDAEAMKKALKQRLDAARMLADAQARMQTERITDEQEREDQAASDRLMSRYRELMDQDKLEKTDREALNLALLAIQEEYLADLAENERKANEKRLKEQQKEEKSWEDTHKHLAWAAQDSIAVIDGAWANSLSQWISEGKSFSEATKNLWKNIADGIIIQLIRIGTQYLMLLAVKGIVGTATGGFGGFLIKALGGHAGGTFEKGRRMGSGGSFTVPGGYPNDSFPLMVQSGERVTVTPAGRAYNDGKQMDTLIKKVDTLGLGLMAVSGRQSPSDVLLHGQLRGQDIFLSNRKAGRVYGRTR